MSNLDSVLQGFLEKYMPRIIHEHLRNEFSMLIQSSMIMVEYEVRFYELSRHAIMILPTKYERIGYFVRGFDDAA